MQFFVKLLITNAVIVTCVLLGKRLPTLAGLIAAMPLTTLLVLVWLYTDAPGDPRLLEKYTAGVLWGIVPTALFFAAAWFCFRHRIPFSVTIALSFAVWLVGAVVHQWLVR